MKYYLLAGEASGDLHGSYLMRAIQRHDPKAEFRFWGGDRMAAIGGTLVVHYKERAFMGFAEVIGNLRKILGFISACKADIEQYQPDRLIFIDNSGFNLRIAKWAKPKGYNTHYYISPQVWASRASRVKTIKATIDRMYVVLPFVEAFYKKYNYEVHFVGHPLLDVITEENRSSPSTLNLLPLFSRREGNPMDLQSSQKEGLAARLERRMDGESEAKKHIHKYANSQKSVEKYNEFSKKENFKVVKENYKLIALLPGSRRQEIKLMLPIMLAAAARYPDYHYVIAQAPSQELDLYQSVISKASTIPPQLSITKGATYHLLREAHAALVTSGTATLETGLFGVPLVVCYKGSRLSYEIARRIVDVKYISLVNLVLDKPLVKELIQNELTVKNLSEELKRILNGPDRNRILTGLQKLREVLGEKGAAERTAKLIVLG